MGKLTVALDTTVTDELKQEGIARELVNRVQNQRKSSGFEVTDKIDVGIKCAPVIWEALRANLSYICAEILADSVTQDDAITAGETAVIDNNEILIAISKI